jgi:hypothetical protein
MILCERLRRKSKPLRKDGGAITCACASLLYGELRQPSERFSPDKARRMSFAVSFTP